MTYMYGVCQCIKNWFGTYFRPICSFTVPQVMEFCTNDKIQTKQNKAHLDHQETIKVKTVTRWETNLVLLFVQMTMIHRGTYVKSLHCKNYS